MHRSPVRQHGPVKRLVILADHTLVVAGIRQALRQTAGFQLVAVLDGRRGQSAVLRRLHPDVVVVDEMGRREDAIARLRETSAVAPQAMTMVLAAEMDDAWIEEALDAGGHAVLSKAVHAVTLGTLLRETAERHVVCRFERTTVATGPCPLTTRELEILQLAAQGRTNTAIARELWITEQTVKFHLSNVYRKLDVTNRTEASRYAYLHGLTTDAPPVALAG